MSANESRDKLLPVYGKYEVIRTDRRDRKGEKHEGCTYFVLDLTHDPHAVPALKAYAKSCEKTHPFLSTHIKMGLMRLKNGESPWGKLSTRSMVVQAAKAIMPDEDYGE